MNCSGDSSSNRTADQGLREIEVSALRQEILADTRQCFDIARFALVAASALVGYALAGNHTWIALLPTVILFAAREQIISRKGNILRIACYLKVFGGKTLRYEERLWQLRNQEPAMGWPANRLRSFRLLSVAGYVSIMAFSIALHSGDVSILRIEVPWFKTALCLLSGVLAAAVWERFSRSQSRRMKIIVDHNKLEKDLHQKWRAITRRR